MKQNQILLKKPADQDYFARVSLSHLFLAHLDRNGILKLLYLAHGSRDDITVLVVEVEKL